MKYVGEPHDPRNAALADNDSSYVLRRQNTSLAYHTVSKIFINQVYFVWMPLDVDSNQTIHTFWCNNDLFQIEWKQHTKNAEHLFKNEKELPKYSTFRQCFAKTENKMKSFPKCVDWIEDKLFLAQFTYLRTIQKESV